MNYVYKIRHKPSGLFYRPASRCQLDIEGKSYTKKPAFSYLKQSLWLNSKMKAEFGLDTQTLYVDKSDFEICKFVIVLDETFQYIKK